MTRTILTLSLLALLAGCNVTPPQMNACERDCRHHGGPWFVRPWAWGRTCVCVDGTAISGFYDGPTHPVPR